MPEHSDRFPEILWHLALFTGTGIKAPLENQDQVLQHNLTFRRMSENLAMQSLASQAEEQAKS